MENECDLVCPSGVAVATWVADSYCSYGSCCLWNHTYTFRNNPCCLIWTNNLTFFTTLTINHHLRNIYSCNLNNKIHSVSIQKKHFQFSVKDGRLRQYINPSSLPPSCPPACQTHGGSARDKRVFSHDPKLRKNNKRRSVREAGLSEQLKGQCLNHLPLNNRWPRKLLASLHRRVWTPSVRGDLSANTRPSSRYGPIHANLQTRGRKARRACVWLAVARTSLRNMSRTFQCSV